MKFKVECGAEFSTVEAEHMEIVNGSPMFSNFGPKDNGGHREQNLVATFSEKHWSKAYCEESVTYYDAPSVVRPGWLKLAPDEDFIIECRGGVFKVVADRFAHHGANQLLLYKDGKAVAVFRHAHWIKVYRNNGIVQSTGAASCGPKE